MKATEYWNSQFSNKPFQQGKAPLKFLAEMLPRLQKGKTLDIGMGEGANSVYLAMKGFKVIGVDISPTAVEHANQLAKDSGVSIETKVTDLDLYILGLMEYDTITMTFFKPAASRYYSEIIRSLKQGGTLFVHSYMIHEQNEPLGPEDAYKNFYYGPNELLKNIAGLRVLFYHEGEVDGRHVVQCLAQKPIDQDAAKFNLFNMSSGAVDTVHNKQKELAESLFKKK